MIIEITIPTPGESITEVDLASWLVDDGALVSKNQEIAEIESDKATLPLITGKAGKLKILVEEGATVEVGTVACTIDTSVEAAAEDVSAGEESKPVTLPKENEVKETHEAEEAEASDVSIDFKAVKTTPLARKLMEEQGLNVDDIIKGLKKITTHEVKQVLDAPDEAGVVVETTGAMSREMHREPMSQLRKKLSKRLVAVKNETAMLTTFNEIDMSAAMALRKMYQKAFVDKHGVKLGYMSLFSKAAAVALQSFPKVNSMIDSDAIITHNYVDIAIAVQTDKGLMVPVLRNVESKTLPRIEVEIAELAKRARAFRLSIDEMSGGTFTITNGGVFGSMLSTPIINPPQSGILGMHNIVERPVVVDGKVEIRPIMYVALSYDHRIIDGRDSVSFLVKVKELIEEPHKLLLGTRDQDKMLLDL